MITTIDCNNTKITIDLAKPIDISIPIDTQKQNINAWYVEDPTIKPVSIEDWIGSVSAGADVNFNTINFNPHAHITHTECVGHITEEVHSINDHLQRYFFLAELISVTPQKNGSDAVITEEQLKNQITSKNIEAIVIRTLPNKEQKISARYSNTNPPYLTEEAAQYLKDNNIKHLLIDLPSVDKEKDEGKLLAHHAFWNTSGKIRFDATITEFIYVPNTIEDGNYMINIMVAPFANDATPSKPILYKILA